MKLHVRAFWSLMAMALLATACAGGDQTTEPAPSPDVEAEPAATEVAASAAAEVAPAVVATDDELIAAAVAQIEADVAAGQGPAGAIAYDVLDTSAANGNVTLTICAWDGETVFDSVLAALYRTSVDSDGAVTASLITAPVAPGECVNTHLIDTALDFIDEVEEYWGAVVSDPGLHTAVRGADLFTPKHGALRTELVQRLIDGGTYYERSSTGSDLRADVVADVLFRRYIFEDQAILEVVLCRPMNPRYGLYKDGVLVDDERQDGFPGLHVVNAYQLALEAGVPAEFLIAGTDNLAWSDCLSTDDWPSAANLWRPRETPLEVLPQ